MNVADLVPEKLTIYEFLTELDNVQLAELTILIAEEQMRRIGIEREEQ